MKKSVLIKLFVCILTIVMVTGLCACSKKSDDPDTPPHTHTVVTDEAVSPTCTQSGLTQGSHCSTCNMVFVAQEAITALDHILVDEIVSEATCVSEGTKKYSCSRPSCNYSYTDTFSLPTYTATELYNQAITYVGEIVTYDKSGAEYALGTGFVISSDGKIVTNYHVLEGAYSATITINNVTYTISSVLSYDANIDLAVLKINATGLTAATICKLPVNVGETVYAIGSSRGMTNTYSQGIVTYADRIVDGVSHIQHDASITHGNSGGPLINIYGEVIGINTWGISDSQNLNFAVFTDELDNLVYGAPLTLAQFCELTNDSYDKLVDYILKNGEYNSNTGEIELTLLDDYNSSRTEYHIVIFSYNQGDGSVDLTHFVGVVGDNLTFFTGIALEKNVDSYYYAMFVNVAGSTTNKISGYIECETFTDNTLVGYNTYEGTSSLLESTRENASMSAIVLVETLEWLATNYLDLTIADFGFVSF